MAPVLMSPQNISSAIRPPKNVFMVRDAPLALNSCAVLLRQRHRRAAELPRRDDRHLVDRVGVLAQVLHDGVAGLVVGGGELFLFVDHAALLRPAPADLVARLFEVVLLDVLPCPPAWRRAPTR